MEALLLIAATSGPDNWRANAWDRSNNRLNIELDSFSTKNENLSDYTSVKSPREQTVICLYSFRMLR